MFELRKWCDIVVEGRASTVFDLWFQSEHGEVRDLIQNSIFADNEIDRPFEYHLGYHAQPTTRLSYIWKWIVQSRIISLLPALIGYPSALILFLCGLLQMTVAIDQLIQSFVPTILVGYLLVGRNQW
jgi:hypothetical protein